jgi:hypothetical protein
MQRHLGWPLPDLGDHDTDVQVVAGPNQSGAEPAPGRSAHQSIGIERNSPSVNVLSRSG